MEVFLGFWFVCAIVGAIIGSAKDAGAVGFFLGLLLGPLGAIAVFAIDNRKQCIKCKTRLESGAVLCPQCGSSVKPIRADIDNPTEAELTVGKAIHFKCRTCMEPQSSPVGDGGLKVLCTQCGEPNTVPDIFGTRPKKQPLLTCDDCGGSVSARASACPHCGAPVDSM